jgi:hypothetical protein
MLQVFDGMNLEAVMLMLPNADNMWSTIVEKRKIALEYKASKQTYP